MPPGNKTHTSEKDDFSRLFARNMTYWRNERGISRKQMACEFGVAESTISLWEAGKRFPSGSNFFLIARYLRVKPCRLLAEFDAARPAECDNLSKCESC